MPQLTPNLMPFLRYDWDSCDFDTISLRSNSRSDGLPFIEAKKRGCPDVELFIKDYGNRILFFVNLGLTTVFKKEIDAMDHPGKKDLDLFIEEYNKELEKIIQQSRIAKKAIT